MGLDMYLSAKRNLYSFKAEDGKVSKDVTELFPELAGRNNVWGEPLLIDCVCVEIAYWRKVNQVHRWFVKNVQKCVDDCGYYFVSRDELKDLRNTCQQVLEDNSLAQMLLPTSQGCFFGSLEYDDDYFDSLQDTIGQIDDALTLPDDWSFEYHSSW